MEYFHLELLNKEQTYNEIFNANPNIGIYKPDVNSK